MTKGRDKRSTKCDITVYMTYFDVKPGIFLTIIGTKAFIDRFSLKPAKKKKHIEMLPRQQKSQHFIFVHCTFTFITLLQICLLGALKNRPLDVEKLEF